MIQGVDRNFEWKGLERGYEDVSKAPSAPTLNQEVVAGSKDKPFSEYLSTKVTSEEFEKMVEETFDKVRFLVIEKAKEYASPDDRFKNFTDSSYELKEAPEKVLLGYLQKHKHSVWSMILALGRGKTFPLKQWDEKVLDMLVYLCLLRGIVITREKEQGL